MRGIITLFFSYVEVRWAIKEKVIYLSRSRTHRES